MSKAVAKKSKAEEIAKKRDEYMEESKAEGKSIWAGKLSPAEKKALASASEFYGLDPNFGHLQILGNKLYVTVEGQRAVAKRENLIEGISLSPLLKEEREAIIPPIPENMHAWKCTIMVIGKKTPFVEYGFASEKDVNLQFKNWMNLSAMARTRAIGRCLRNIVHIDLPVYEELPHGKMNETETVTVDVTEVKDVPPEKDELKKNREKKKQEKEEEAKKNSNTPTRDKVLNKFVETFGNEFKDALILAKRSMLQYKAKDAKEKKCTEDEYEKIWSQVEEMNAEELTELLYPSTKTAKEPVTKEDLKMMHDEINMLLKDISGQVPGKPKKIMVDVSEGKYEKVTPVTWDDGQEIISRLKILIQERENAKKEVPF